MGKYATREGQVDDLLRHDVFVDLFTVVRQGLVVGTSPAAGQSASAGTTVTLIVRKD